MPSEAPERVPSDPLHVPLDVPDGLGVVPRGAPEALGTVPLAVPEALGAVSPRVLEAFGAVSLRILEEFGAVPGADDDGFCVSRLALSMQSLRSCSLRFLHTCCASAALPAPPARPVPCASAASGAGMRWAGVVRSVGCVGGVEGAAPVLPLEAPGWVVCAKGAEVAANAIAAAAVDSRSLGFMI